MTTIATFAQHIRLQSQMQRTRTGLDRLTQEVASGTHADYFAGLGSQATRGMALRAAFAQIGFYKDSAGVAATHLDGQQRSLGIVKDVAIEARGLLLAVQSGADEASPRIIHEAARNQLEQVRAALNHAVAGRFVLAGPAVDRAPLAGTAALDSVANLPFTFDPAVANAGTLDIAIGGVAFSTVMVSPADSTRTRAPGPMDLAANDDEFAPGTPPADTSLATMAAVIQANLDQAFGGDGTGSVVTASVVAGKIQITDRLGRGIGDVAYTPAGAGSLDPVEIGVLGAIKAGHDLRSEAGMQAFLGEVHQVFEGAHPDPTWSFEQIFYRGSTTGRMTSVVDAGTEADLDVRATDPALKAVLEALYVLQAVPASETSTESYRALARAMTERLSEGIGRTVDLAAAVGYRQELVKETLERHARAQAVVNNTLAGLESIDDYQAATRLTALQAQMEMTYTVTARLNRLSLVNFL